LAGEVHGARRKREARAGFFYDLHELQQDLLPNGLKFRVIGGRKRSRDLDVERARRELLETDGDALGKDLGVLA
jgi:hypothetical protein